MQAVILAAGEGTRVRPLTRSRPKAMIPVANRPIIDYVISALVQNGIRDIIVVVGYRKEQVIRYLNTLDLPVTVVVQERQLGTAHALQCAEAAVQGEFLLLPGDNYIDSVSIGKIKGEENAMLVNEHPYPSNFGVVVTEGDVVKGIFEKPQQAPSITVSTGIYSLKKDFFRFLHSTELPDAISGMIEEGVCMRAIRAVDWQDAIYPWDILKMNTKMLRQIPSQRAGMMSSSVVIAGPVSIGKGTTIGPHTTIKGPAVIGNDCEIGPHACIMPGTSIGSRVGIEPFAFVGNSLLMDDVSIGSHSAVYDMVIGEGCLLADHTTATSRESLLEIEGHIQKATFGAVLGDRVTSAPFTVFRNCIIGNNVTVEEGRVITGQVKDGAVVM
ncbi:MAG: NTP transferase domain-containing protein [Methanomicrobiales archaeon]|nr:NTP transferase domain-containing protein [Methanomicrobiales archaeon]